MPHDNLVRKGIEYKMKGTQRVSGVVMKEYIGSSFTGTPTRNYIVILKGNVKCFVYSKMNSACLFKTGDNDVCQPFQNSITLVLVNG